MIRNTVLSAVPLLTAALFCGTQESARAQLGIGPPPVGYSAADSIISAPTIYYPTVWVLERANSGFSYDGSMNMDATGATSAGHPNYSYSASMTYFFYNETGAAASNVIAVTVTAGGAVGGLDSTFNATSNVSYSTATASGSVPTPSSYTDNGYAVDTTVVVPAGEYAEYSGSASGSGYGPTI